MSKLLFQRISHPCRNKHVENLIKKSKSFLSSFNNIELNCHKVPTEISIIRKSSEPNFFNEPKKLIPVCLKRNPLKRKQSYYLSSVPHSPNKSVDSKIPHTNKSYKSKRMTEEHILPQVSRPKKSFNIFLLKNRRPSIENRSRLLNNIMNFNRYSKLYGSNIKKTHRSSIGTYALPTAKSVNNTYREISIKLGVCKDENLQLLPILKISFPHISLITFKCKWEYSCLLYTSPSPRDS